MTWAVRSIALVTFVVLVATATLLAFRAPVPGPDITIDLSVRHQTIDGFGTSLNSWQAKMHRFYETPEFPRLYAEEIGCSMLRINLWGPTLPEPVEDWRDITYEDFALDGKGRRAQVFLDAGKAMRRVNPDMRFIGTVWSPPAWMKENGSLTDTESAGSIAGDGYTRRGRTITNRVKREYYPHFAKWMVEMAKLHRAHGIPLHAISPGNEVMFTQEFESCVWSAEDYATIVALLGEMLNAEGLGDILIYGPETMTGHNWSRDEANELYVRTLKENDTAWRHFDVFATHGYTDGFETDISDTAPAEFWSLVRDTGKRFWITEGGTGRHGWPDALYEFGAILHHALVGGNASAILPWQISDDEPNQHGLMVMDELTPKTRVAQHYFKFIRPGAVRVEATPANAACPVSAYHREADGTLTIVIANPSKAERTVTIRISGAAQLGTLRARRTSRSDQFRPIDPVSVTDGVMSLTLPPESLLTLVGDAVR